MTTNDALPKAIFAAVDADASPMSSAALGGSGILSTLPAYQAAGNISERQDDEADDARCASHSLH